MPMHAKPAWNRTIATIAMAGGLAAALAGCTINTAPTTTTTETVTVPTSGQPTATETVVETASPAAWATTALTSVADCEALADIVQPAAPTDPQTEAGPTFQPLWSEQEPNGPVQSELQNTGVSPTEGCRWRIDTYQWYAVHVGELPQEPSGPLFTTFMGSADGASFPADYSSEPDGDGTVYWVTSACNEKFSCDVLHYVEGEMLVTYVQPKGAGARATLDALVEEFRG